MLTAEYIRKIFEDKALVALGAAWALLYNLVCPEPAYALAAGAVLGIMVLDLITKLFALSRRAGGFWRAVKAKVINSRSLSRGTLDKLVLFAVLLIICGLAYRVSPMTDVAVWFTQLVFALMFLRDALSIVENLNDAGVSGLGPLQRALKRKQQEIGLDDDEPTNITSTRPPDEGGQNFESEDKDNGKL